MTSLAVCDEGGICRCDLHRCGLRSHLIIRVEGRRRETAAARGASPPPSAATRASLAASNCGRGSATGSAAAATKEAAAIRGPTRLSARPGGDGGDAPIGAEEAVPPPAAGASRVVSSLTDSSGPASESLWHVFALLAHHDLSTGTASESTDRDRVTTPSRTDSESTTRNCAPAARLGDGGTKHRLVLAW